jgi:preprotein translocase subunit SecG
VNFVLLFPIAVLSQYFFGTIIFLLSLFMVLLILVQRGKGGGLTGALGGPGGQSAFGTKAGDLFTRITIVAATCWIFLLAFSVWWYTESDFSSALADNPVINTGPSIVAPVDGSSSTFTDPGVSAPAGEVAPAGEAVPATTPATTVPSTVPSETAKASAEVEVGDLPEKTTEASEAKPSSSEIPTPEK